MVIKALIATVIALACVFVLSLLQLNRISAQLTECRSATAQQNQAITDVTRALNARVLEQKAKDVARLRNIQQHQLTTDSILDDRIDPTCNAAIRYGITYAQKLKVAA